MSKAQIKQIAMKNAIRIWGVTNVDQLDPIVRLFIEVFSALMNDNENAIADIKERLLEQIANSLTPDSYISAKPAHSIMKAMPVEPEMEIGRRDVFYTDMITSAAKKYDLKHLNFAPVVDHIKLIKGEIQHVLCERNLYRIGLNEEKELVTRATSFYQDLNRTVWVGFDLDNSIKTLKDIHFYFDFPNTDYRYDLFDLLSHTIWSIDGNSVAVEPGLVNANSNELYGGIFAHYNTSYRNDTEVMELYRKQFLHIKSHIETRKLVKTPFPTELTPFFSGRVNELEPQYWMKIVFPPYFKNEDLEDINISLNAFPVSNKSLNHRTLEREKELVGIMALSVSEGEYFLSPDKVDDSNGMEYNFLPFSTNDSTSLGGTYTIKKGGLERFSTRDLSDTIDLLIDLFRSETVTFNALKMDNIRNSITKMEQFVVAISNRMESNSGKIKEIPTYLLIDSDEKKSSIYASYWTSNCHLVNNMPYGTLFKPLKAMPLEKDSCRLLKAATGGKTTAKSNERIEAYKYALTTRDQLYSISDIENFCRMKFTDKIQYVKAKLGVSVSHKQKEGLIRTLDVNLVASDDYKEILSDPVKQGELKEELEKRSPELYKYRIVILDRLPY